jgi:phage recombination protein Bet
MANELALVSVGFNDDQVSLIKRTICNGASNDELALFIQQCNRTGLDPFSRQIHAVRRGGKMTIQVGIDGLRLVANRTGQTDGQDGPYWCGDDGVWKDVWLSKDKPAACKVTVFRKGQARGYTGVARWAEFYQPTGGMWDRMPATMIAKVAESIALRKGFPQELSGLYAPEELDQSDTPVTVETVAPRGGQHLPADTPRGGQHTSPPVVPATPLEQLKADVTACLKANKLQYADLIAWMNEQGGTNYKPDTRLGDIPPEDVQHWITCHTTA